MYYFSKTTNGFYNNDVHGNTIPLDAVEISDEQYAALLAGQAHGRRISADSDGLPILLDQPTPSPAEILAAYTAAIQARLDEFAKTRGYDGILSACSYATSTNAKFAAEGQYCVEARDNTWSKCYAIMADVESGKRQMPTLDDIMDELPALDWPDANI